MRILALLLLIVGVSPASDVPASKPLNIPTLKYEKYKLANGLEVILYESHRLPLVAVDVWYHVGPMNEKAGRTGFAHLFEHMMFEGSEHVGEKAHFAFLERAGATDINGTTDFDRTNYFETVPSNQLELALWLESDRMGFLLETLDRSKLTNQRDVVRNERRQGEGRPYGLTEEATFHLLFPNTHPYYADVIGSHADIEAARLNDVRDFFHAFYTPNNATIAIAGDFDPVKLKALVAKYFAPIPSGPPVEKVDVTTPAITAERRATVTDTVQLSRVTVAWLTPQAFHAGDAEAQLVLQILGGTESSRLYRRLVYEQQIAQEVRCEYQPLSLASVAMCDVTARPGINPEALESAMDKEIADIRANGVTQAELERARNIILAKKITALQRLGGFGGVADMMDLYNQYLGDPGYLDKDVRRFEIADVESVHKIAEQQFGNNQRVVVDTVPGKKVVDDVPRSPADTDANVTLKDPYTSDFEQQENWRKTPPTPGPTPPMHLPVPKVFTLTNGLTVYLVEDHAFPVISATVVDLAGADGNPASKPGLAGFTARMLTAGTNERSAMQIADDSDQIGAQLKCQADDDGARGAIAALSNHSDGALDLLADITQHPAFQPAEVERVRKERLADIVQEADRPTGVALRVGPKLLYGDHHPYAYPATGTTASVQEISREDLTGFWSAHYGPQNAALVLVGDLTEGEAHRLAEKYFQSWANRNASAPPIPAAPKPPKFRIVIVDKPGAPQTVLGAFGVGLQRANEDYPGVEVMNGLLGGLFSSRLNMNLREKNGFTYGAFSMFFYHRGDGPFLAVARVRTDVTAPATREMMAELNRIRTDPPTKDELKLSKENALRSLPGQFETVDDTSKQIAALFTYKLPVAYYATLPGQYETVTSSGVKDMALKYVHPENVVVIAVGDRAKIQPGLEKLNLGPIELRNESGDPLPK